MIDFAALEVALVAWVKAHSGLEQAVWENAPRPYTKKTYAMLSWVSSASRGVPETTFAIDGTRPAGTDFVPTTTDHQVLVLQVSAESIAQTPDASARQALEALRVRSRTPRALDELASAGLGLAAVGDATRADYLADQRMVQRWVLELRLNAASSYRDASGGISRIEHAQLVPTNVTNPAGAPVDPDLVPTEEVP